MVAFGESLGIEPCRYQGEEQIVQREQDYKLLEAAAYMLEKAHFPDWSEQEKRAGQGSWNGELMRVPILRVL